MTIRKQLTTFAAIGIINTAVDITLYTLLIWLMYHYYNFNHRRDDLQLSPK